MMSEKSIIALKRLQISDGENDIAKRSLINNIKKNSRLSSFDGSSLIENPVDHLNHRDCAESNTRHHEVELFRNRGEGAALSYFNNESISHIDGTESYKRLDSSLSGKEYWIYRILSKFIDYVYFLR